MNEKGIAKKGIIIILFICLALIVTSCSKGQTEAANNQTAQGVTASSVQTQNKKENHVEPIKVNMSVEQKKELDTFFSKFAEVELKPFAKDQLKDDELVSFALHQLGKAGKGLRDVSATDAEAMELKYFGRCIKATEHQTYSRYWIYKDGVYKVLGRPGFGGFMPPFSQINELWDYGDGIFTALISVYDQIDGWKGDPHAKPEEWNQGPPELIPELKGKYHALIRLVREGSERHYILLEYLKDE